METFADTRDRPRTQEQGADINDLADLVLDSSACSRALLFEMRSEHRPPVGARTILLSNLSSGDCGTRNNRTPMPKRKTSIKTVADLNGAVQIEAILDHMPKKQPRFSGSRASLRSRELLLRCCRL